mgnify:CR=1 FL=1
MAEKLDVIDLIISTLREHERSLDEVSRELRETSGELGRAAETIREAAHLFREASTASRPSASDSESSTPKPPASSSGGKAFHPIRMVQEGGFKSHTVQIRPPPQPEHPSKPAVEEVLPSEEDEPKHVLRQILQLLDRFGFLSITQLQRLTSTSRNYLAGFLAGLESCNIITRRGTPTHKLYLLSEQGRRLYQILKRR